MDTSKILIYDGSFNGFLTSIYTAFDEKIQVADIQKNNINQNGLFSETKTIPTQIDKAKRVWNGIQSKSNSAIKHIYFAYLSEYEGIEQLLYRYIQKLYITNPEIISNMSDGITTKVEHLAKNVGREKQRMEAFIGFQTNDDGLYFANVSPQFDILPLISKYFKSKYPEQQWMIYDEKRKYGLHYNLKKVEIIPLDLQKTQENNYTEGDLFSNESCHNNLKQHSESQINSSLFKSILYNNVLQTKSA